ncbi:hypothetical protein MUK42_14410 [Musa troglodytarum]|uniref:Jacalin-type lectin domain-containing protein n=1 Tax=Musa troglodytarum TaxID=320322 RepID=A0A9E7L951_9LILI|nr:hypothetical protein MUK42_14410 [Musa troglodytarum]
MKNTASNSNNNNRSNKSHGRNPRRGIGGRPSAPNVAPPKGMLFCGDFEWGKVVKEGPWGGNAGKQFDTGSVDRFINVKIYYEDVVGGLKLTFQDGKIPPVLIGKKTPAFVEITLGEDEHFTSISGYFKSETDVDISQLTLTTDMNSSISAGKKTGKAFCLTLEKEITLWASLDVINRISPWMPLECTARWLIPRYGCTSP